MKKSKFIFCLVALMTLGFILSACHKEEDFNLEFQKNLSGSTFVQGDELQIMIIASSECDIVVKIDDIVFVSETDIRALKVTLPTTSVGDHLLDVYATSDTKSAENSWIYTVVAK